MSSSDVVVHVVHQGATKMTQDKRDHGDNDNLHG
jgi:hypothetical protein